MTRGRRTPRRGAVTSRLALLEHTIASSAFTWLRPDSLSGANLLDRVDPTHTMTKSGGATITASANFANKPVVNFNGVTTYTSTRAAADWGFLTKGTGGSIFFAYNAAVADQYPFVLGASGLPTSIIYSLSTGNGGALVYNDTTAFVNVDAATFFRPGSAYIEVTYKESDSPKVTVRRNGVTVATSNVTSPSANDPAGTLILGGRTGVFAGGEFADCIVFDDAVTPTLRSRVEQYMFLRYAL
jgi:hypothetical protein